MTFSRMQRTLALITMVMILFPLGAGGAIEQPDSKAVVSIIDSRGQRIALPAFPRRIVSLSPNITETLFALDLAHTLVGRTDYCDYPAEAVTVQSMGDLFSPSIENIVAARPDLVIISNLGQMQTVEAIERSGIPVAFLDEPGTMEGTFRIIELVGRITGAAEPATRIIEGMKATLEEVRSTIGPPPYPTAYYVAGFGEWGDFTATGDTYLHDIISYAGADNIAADAVNWTYQLELLISQDPDIIILPPMWASTFERTREEFVNHPSYADLRAVKSNRIITIESNLMERQGPRSAEAVQQLARQIKAIMR